LQRPDGEEALERVRRMRREAPEAEARLWSALRGRRLSGAKFRRQVWIGGYVADFLCAEAKLIVEADGGQHGRQQAYDVRRTVWLEEQGFRVIRIWNNDIADNLDGVLATIGQALTLPPPDGRRAPPSPVQGEGV